MGLEQKTVNLVVVIGVIVIAAGAWSAPLLTAQTVHTTLSGDIDAAVVSINQNTDDETGEVETSIFGSSFDNNAFQGCELMDMMMAIALDVDLKKICGEAAFDNIQSAVIGEGQFFDDFKDTFEFEPELLSVTEGVLLPFRDCDDSDDPANQELTDLQIMGYDLDRDGVITTDNDDQIISTVVNSFGAVKCIHSFNATDTPLRITQLTVFDIDVADTQDIRLQLAVVEDEDAAVNVNTNNCGDDVETDFVPNVIYDGIIPTAGVTSVSINIDLGPFLPPDFNKNLCARIAELTGGGAADYAVWISATDEFPISIFEFIPDENFAQFDFEHFSPVDFTDVCGIIVRVLEDDNATPVSNAPVTILNPFVFGFSDLSATVLTNTTGHAVFGVGAGAFTDDAAGADDEKMPSGFYVIDVNVAESHDWSGGNPFGGAPIAHDGQAAPAGTTDHTLSGFGQDFPDQQIGCTAQKDNEGNVVVTSNITDFSSASNQKTLVVRVEDNSNFSLISGATVSGTGTDIQGTAVNIAADTTDANGEVTFGGLLPGVYTLTVSAAGFTTDTFFVGIDLFGPGTIQIVVGLN